MKESVIYQDILQKGRQQEALLFCIRLLNRRLGEVDSLLTERVRVLSTDQLEALGEALLDFYEADDLVVWLEQQERN